MVNYAVAVLVLKILSLIHWLELHLISLRIWWHIVEHIHVIHKDLLLIVMIKQLVFLVVVIIDFHVRTIVISQEVNIVWLCNFALKIKAVLHRLKRKFIC